MRSAIDQMAEVGFEMMIYSFGSGFSIEISNESYLKHIADDIAYAHSKGIEVCSLHTFYTSHYSDT